MRLAYVKPPYRQDSSTGGNAHIGQFIASAARLGHEVWTWPGDQHPCSHHLNWKWILIEPIPGSQRSAESIDQDVSWKIVR